MGQQEYENIMAKLREMDLPFHEYVHESVRTSQEAADVRGSKLSEGVKSLLVKFKRPTSADKDWFAVIDIPADRKLDWKKTKAVLQASSVALASEAEVLEHTGCELGGVPPFGHKTDLAILVDPLVFSNDSCEFNVGLKTNSIRIKSADLKRMFDAIGVAYFALVS